MARSAILVCLPLVAIAVPLGWGCGGGTAGPVPSTTSESPEKPGTPGREPAPGGREAAGSTETPPASQDPAPPSTDPTGAGTGTTTTSSCPKCDADFVCTETANGQTVTDVKISLKLSNGVCAIAEQQVVTVLLCNGKVTQNGVAAGTWRANGEGFVASGSGVTLDCKPAPVAQPGTK